ncbi:MAG: DUF58 domain-containing protein [Gammaproteobacteria bacterium]|nr:DUF58 domain-containing protein [Gammaproteobacteria bacterium]
MIAKLFQFNRHTEQNTSSDKRLNDESADGLVRVSSKSLIALRKRAETLPLNVHKILSNQTGSYLSPFKGRGMEFEEARTYQPGDDIRNMDWRVTARTGTAHTKVFREERERAVFLWVDYRRPMFFATQGAFKSVIAAQSASLLSWSAIQHGDRLGGLIFSEHEHDEIRPQRGDKAVLHFINKLANHPAWQNKLPQSNQSLTQPLARLRRVAKPGSLIILCSDFQGMDEQAESHLIQIARHNDVILNFIYDPLECQLPVKGTYHISDGRQRALLNTADKKIAQSHADRFQQHQEYLRSLSRRHGMFLLNTVTNDDVLATLQKQMGFKRK